MELTLENKAKFMYQYWGQEVFKLQGLDKIYKSPYVEVLDEDHLLLKQLSSITDEDAIEVSKIVRNFYTKEPLFSISEVKLFLSDWMSSVDFIALALYINDYLRSKGYALPWMGLSVEEMIEAGWIKLKS